MIRTPAAASHRFYHHLRLSGCGGHRRASDRRQDLSNGPAYSRTQEMMPPFLGPVTRVGGLTGSPTLALRGRTSLREVDVNRHQEYPPRLCWPGLSSSPTVGAGCGSATRPDRWRGRGEPSFLLRQGHAFPLSVGHQPQPDEILYWAGTLPAQFPSSTDRLHRVRSSSGSSVGKTFSTIRR